MATPEMPSNSREKGPKKEVEPKKIEQVTVNEVQRRKKPLGKRFTETFVQGEAKGAASYVLYDVLIPAAKDAVADAFSQGIERMLFGEVRSRSRRGASAGPTTYTSYGRYSSGPANVRREEPRNISKKARGAHDFDEIILATRPEAEEVIDRLNELLSRYGSASVGDMYELVGITSNYTDEKWGWTDLRGSEIIRVRDGYLLDLPRPDSLD